jgi:hypothetical protein
MKIHTSKQKDYDTLCQKYSTDIEYDTILKYANKLSCFLESKIMENPCQKNLDLNFEQGCSFADIGVTHDMHRRAIELLSKYWIFGDFLIKHKI